MSAMVVTKHPHGRAVVVRPHGVLDLSTYAALRDALLKCAADDPSGIVVDLSELAADRVSSLSVFPTVALRISPWPGVPLVLAAPGGDLAGLLAGSAVARFVPVHDRVDVALEALSGPCPRRLARTRFVTGASAPGAVRSWVREICVRWSVTPVDGPVLVASELATNVVTHTTSEELVVRLEMRPAGLSVAVADADPRPPALGPGGVVPTVSGLVLVDMLSRVWGHSPRWDGGKVVWAVLALPGGPEGPLMPAGPESAQLPAREPFAREPFDGPGDLGR